VLFKCSISVGATCPFKKSQLNVSAMITTRALKKSEASESAIHNPRHPNIDKQPFYF